MAFIRTKKHRLLDNNTYMLQSEWTSSRDVEMNDGKTLEEKLSPLTQDITEIKLVTSLPSNAASNPTTLYVLIDS